METVQFSRGDQVRLRADSSFNNIPSDEKVTIAETICDERGQWLAFVGHPPLEFYPATAFE